jgi:predicted small lipoprotein YifL
VILIVALLYVFSATGCGKKGPPVPPVDKREPVKEESRWQPPGKLNRSILTLNSKHEIRNSNDRMTKTRKIHQPNCGFH